MREKKDRMDAIKQKYSRRSRQNSNSATRPPQKRTPSQVSDATSATQQRRRRVSPAGPVGDKTTRCTRDEDINIEDFMKEDMY